MGSLVPEIKNLEPLLEKHLKKKIRILNQDTKFLTAPGENYGSIMTALNITIEDSNQIEENINLVAKLIPTNELLRQIFQIQVTFKKELSVYTKIVPALAQLEEEYGVKEDRASDLFCKCFGGRSNLESEYGFVDEDAVLLLENLKLIGYENGDRLKGFDYDSAVFVLKYLAIYHATPIALKLLKPDVFKEQIEDTLSVPQKTADVDKEKIEIFITGLMAIINTNYSKPLLIEKLSKMLLGKFTGGIYQSNDPQKPFVTFIHSDFWVNNMMLEKDTNGKPVNLKIVDFQTPQCQSLTYDLLFFIFSSVAPSVLYDNVDELIKIYFDSFINCLKQFKVTELENYSWEAFQREIKEYALDILCQLLYMYKPILLKRGQIADMNEFNDHDLFGLDNMSEDCTYRMRKTFEMFVDKEWIC